MGERVPVRRGQVREATATAFSAKGALCKVVSINRRNKTCRVFFSWSDVAVMRTLAEVETWPLVESEEVRDAD